jgi:hypothetical protein
MEEQASTIRECPLCREVILVDAVRCKHCLGAVTPEAGGHGGVCPYCKEEIHPEAIRCKHCKADIGSRKGGCEGCADSVRVVPRLTRERRFDQGTRRFARERHTTSGGVVVGPHQGWGSCGDCPAWIEFPDGWFGILVGCNDATCSYAQY